MKVTRWAGPSFRIRNPAVPCSQYRGVGSIVGVKFAQDRADVVLYGLLADVEYVSYLLVRVTLGDVVKNLCLPFGEGGGYGFHSFAY